MAYDCQQINISISPSPSCDIAHYFLSRNASPWMSQLNLGTELTSPPARRSLGGALSACIRWIATLLFLSIVNARSEFKQRVGPAKRKKRKENSRPLMQTVKNNNQECSIREMHSPRLWVLQVGCTVITSPEDPGEESFHEKRGRTGEAGELHALQASLCSPPFLKQNMNANISSANRVGTQETLVLFFLLSSSHEMFLFTHTHAHLHTGGI